VAVDIDYDFGAAESLSRTLAQLHDKLVALAQTRERHRRSLLNPHWRGAAHDRFEQAYPGQQRILGLLAERARQLQKQVDSATADAREAQHPK
jgi:uncharacterized protein YukE